MQKVALKMEEAVWRRDMSPGGVEGGQENWVMEEGGNWGGL